ncbi:helix-turn-helix domain-containing protein [Methylobacterium sp. WL122]|nr:helix-turn-helix domain-containing protein [Methylobacterium sp. WL122]
MEQLRTEVTVEGQVAGRLLNLSRNTTYKALRSGDIPSVRIGAQYRVPTAKLREMLGMSPPAQSAPIAA